jgi:hypothetical protein
MQISGDSRLRPRPPRKSNAAAGPGGSAKPPLSGYSAFAMACRERT